MSKRELDSVIGDMLGMIPESETELRSELESIRRGSHYCPPEAMRVEWSRTFWVLVEHISEPKPGWQTDVARCFRGSP